jgi:hypothetical protein
MKTVKCTKHNTLIVILDPDEERIFTSKLDTTVVFFDSHKKPYLKRCIRGQCDENCPTVDKVLTSLEPAVPQRDISDVLLSENPNLF